MGLLKTDRARLLVGAATAEATIAYSHRQGQAFAHGHYSDFQGGVKLSAIGLGTFPGAATDAVDRAIADIIHRGLTQGLNVVDTATHYRYGRSLAAIGMGLQRAVAEGVDRKAVWLMSKGGFVSFTEGVPTDPKTYIETEIVAKGLALAEECVGTHILSSRYLRAQIDRSRDLLGVETLDAFLVDQPEVHIPVAGKAAVIAKLGEVFVELERAVKDGAIRFYGVSSFHAFRVPTDDPLFISLTSLVALAEKAAKEVVGKERDHHFALIELPFNAVMLDGFSRFNQITGDGNEASTLQAALQLKLYTVASHGLFKGHLAQQSVDILTQAMPQLANNAQRALQFNRSTPGLGTTLVGLSSPAHLDDVLAVARAPLLRHESYMALYHRTEN
ncbi:MAG TPA: aldo/keto reductase [Acidiferrobacter sp.]|nr:aldo/keto reductase [Acidiferrobacter sp.]